MKHVFTDMSAIAHLWANQQQDNARTPGNGNFYFDGKTIYPYGSHFPIATHVVNEKGITAVLFTTRTYSSATSGHINTVRAASSHLNKIYCPYPLSEYSDSIDNEKNFNYWLKEIEGIATSLTNARKPEKYLSQINYIANQVNKYVEFFDLKIPAKLQAAMNIANKEQYLKYSIVKAELEAREEKAHQRKLKIQNAKELKKFYSYEISHLYTHGELSYLRISKDGTQIETSQNVQIPVAIAKRFYDRIKAVILNGGCENCDIPFMSYSVLNINADFIRIGCHKISMAEINRIAKLLNI